MVARQCVESRERDNRSNGKMSKTVQTQYGEVTVEIPRDRDGSFEPQTVRKREKMLAEGMADQIIGMYAFGTSTREIDRFAIQTIYVPSNSVEKYKTAEGRNEYADKINEYTDRIRAISVCNDR